MVALLRLQTDFPGYTREVHEIPVLEGQSSEPLRWLYFKLNAETRTQQAEGMDLNRQGRVVTVTANARQLKKLRRRLERRILPEFEQLCSKLDQEEQLKQWIAS